MLINIDNIIETVKCNLTLDSKALSVINNELKDKMEVVIKEKSEEILKKFAGNRPTYKIKVYRDNDVVSDFKDSTIEIFISY